MKIQGAKKIHYDSGPNMTPLVDIVMVILIFLMLAGTFGGAEHYLVSNMPYTARGAGNVAPPPSWVPDFPFELHVYRGAQNELVVRVGDRQIKDKEQLRQLLSQQRQALNSSGKSTDKIQVSIHPAKIVRYQQLIDVYDAALRADFTKVAFATSH